MNNRFERMMGLGRFGLYGYFTAVEGKRDELSEILVRASQKMRQLEECDIYSVSIMKEEADNVYVYEVWKNEQAHQASLTLDVTQDLIRKAKPIIAGMERIHSFQSLND
ncbi:antibiotic biosynthesis monooxygenase [Radiobacillus kanasensis]|uniref:putative quinol monooxygenase n=1 Tax=Radiobacillus kanasensis TaxID=2844358 RepID=UPI001E5C6471|nr:antibiotic biosynthesis monooxygenase [Radiobacillus kanasensis]UFT98329.1 antibiotic biosynthesis monooxygenase [Radiobacillus kanasensis]